jgi:hypothetical protein
MRKLKIIGKFANTGTEIIDLDNGHKIPNVRKVTWVHEVGHAPVCMIELVGVELAAEGTEITSMDDGPFRRFKEASPARTSQATDTHPDSGS